MKVDLGDLLSIFKIGSKLDKIMQEIQDFKALVQQKLDSIASNIGNINQDQETLLAKIEGLGQSSTLSEEDKAALANIASQMQTLVDTTAAIDAQVPNPGSEGDPNNV